MFVLFVTAIGEALSIRALVQYLAFECLQYVKQSVRSKHFDCIGILNREISWVAKASFRSDDSTLDNFLRVTNVGEYWIFLFYLLP